MNELALASSFYASSILRSNGRERAEKKGAELSPCPKEDLRCLPIEIETTLVTKIHVRSTFLFRKPKLMGSGTQQRGAWGSGLSLVFPCANKERRLKPELHAPLLLNLSSNSPSGLDDAETERAIVTEWAFGILDAIRSDLRLAVQASVRAGASYDRQYFGRPGEGRPACAKDSRSSVAASELHTCCPLYLNHASDIIDHQAVFHDEQTIISLLAPRTPGSHLLWW